MIYLKNRGITRHDIVRYGIGYCESGPYEKMIIIPSYDKDGKLNFFTGRSYYKDASFKHKNPKVSKDIIGFDLFINWNEPITIVEGAFDAIAVKRNAIPLFGKIILKKLKKQIIKKNVKDIYIALDSDARDKALDICQYFIDNGIRVYLIELGDKDPSELGYKNIIWTLYRSDKSNEAVLTFASNMNLYAITMSPPRARSGLAVLLKNKKIKTYVHTINSVKEYFEYVKMYKVDQIYTDWIK